MTDQFPTLLKQAAEDFTNECTAFAQFRIESGQFKARLQATEIMKQFVGDVTFGQDPKGILFYKRVSDFNISRVNFTYTKYSGPGNISSIKVDFSDEGMPPFARFLARFDIQKYPIPLNPSAGGNGRWTTFKAATAQVDAVRQQDSTRLYLQLAPIGRETYFNTTGRSGISASGILIFRDLKKLKNKPLEDDPNGQDNRPLVADIAPDRIVFHLQKKVGETKLKEFGLFLPTDPLQDIGPPSAQPPDTNWRDFEPESGSNFAKAEEDDAADDAAN